MRKFKIKLQVLGNRRSNTITTEYLTSKVNEQEIYEDAKEYLRANYGQCHILSMIEIK